MPSWVLISWAFLLVVYVADIITCYRMDVNLSSDFKGEAREFLGDWCVIPPPLQNGKYRPSRYRCPPGDTTPACQMLEGAFVFPNWTIYLDSCDPGYVVDPKSTVAVCVHGRWLPRLPTCVVCSRSDTLVNGKTVCRGDVIFEDTFSGTLSKKWNHWVFFGANSWRFNEFTMDKKNSFISNGNLVIRPTVHHESYVASGTRVLDGCTHTEGSEDCVRTSTPDSIFPPVDTANLVTEGFDFTYGEVKIRARLPKGDWLIPEFWMGPTKDYYGSGDSSGRIQFGLSLGNSNLQCDGENFGLGRVESRLTLGPENKLSYQEYVLKNRSLKWFDDYHNFTLIWKPGSIAFKIDDEWTEEIAVKNQTLCEEQGYTKEDCKIYSDGSILAPFDKDFFIGITLTVGDLFTADECTNRGKVKPWKSNEPKDVMKFWKDRQNWLSTWTEDGSSLYIDYVRVTAV